MSMQSYRPPSNRSDSRTSLLLGAGFASGLFVVMALAQMIGGVKPPSNEFVDEIVAFVPPELEVIDEEPPPPPEAEEPPPELEPEPA